MTTPTTTTATVVTLAGDGYTILVVRDRADGQPGCVCITEPNGTEHRWTVTQLDLRLNLARRWVSVLETALGMLRGSSE